MRAWQWHSLISGLLLLAGVTGLSAAPKRVLILHSFGSEVAPYSAASSLCKTTLARELGEPVDVYELSLDTARFGDLETDTPAQEYIYGHLAQHRPDLVIPIGAPSAMYVIARQNDLFRDIPIIFAAADPRWVPPEALRSNATLVTQSVRLSGMVDDIMQLRPDTTNIVVIFGNSALERYWVAESQLEFQQFTNRVSFTWLNDLSLDQMERRVAVLPPRSFVLFGMLILDAGGAPYEMDEGLKRIRAAATAPVYGYFQSQLGLGTVGGHLFQDETVGTEAARVAIRILRGESPADIRPKQIETPHAAYDWRELRRWNIASSTLPAGSRILFREPSVWERYRWSIVAVTTLCVVEAALIAALVSSLASRRRAEETARDLSQRLIHSQEQERARLARELHDDITQRLARLVIDAAQLERAAPDSFSSGLTQLMRQELMRLSEDVHSLSYRLHPSLLEDLGLPAALKAECERFVQGGAIRATVNIAELPNPVPTDAALGLFRVVQEALRNVARHSHASTVDVSLRGLDDGLQLSVRDDGIGFDSSNHHHQPSLGLASMRERLRLLAGELDIDSAPGQGTTIIAWVPLRKGSL